MGNLKTDTNELMVHFDIDKQKQTLRHRKQTYNYQRGQEGGGGEKLWFGFEKLQLYIKIYKK